MFRRRRFRRGFSRKPLQRVSYQWAHAVFNESAIDRIGNLNEKVLFDQSDWVDTDNPTSRQHALVERIIVTGSMTWVRDNATVSSNLCPFGAAIYMIDEDDLDEDNLWTSTGTDSLLRNSSRFLWSKYRQLAVLENSGTTYSATDSTPNDFEIEVDIKVKVKVPLEGVIALGMQFSGTSDQTIALAAFSGLARVLWRKL